MAKEAFKGIKISSLVEHVGGEGVAKRMDAAAFVYAGFFLATENTFWAVASLRCFSGFCPANSHLPG